MTDAGSDVSLFLHIRVLIGMVLGLGIARLLNGLARIIQHPGRDKLYWVHLGWALWMLLMLLHFWWWEYRLYDVEVWSFRSYLYVVGYAVLFYLICTLLFPDDMSDYSGYRDYFLSRRRWIFALIALSFVVDVGDSLIKGNFYINSLGPEYPLRIIAHVSLCLVAMLTRNGVFHGAFLLAALGYQVSWISRYYQFL
jgi:hypothetical protein